MDAMIFAVCVKATACSRSVQDHYPHLCVHGSRTYLLPRIARLAEVRNSLTMWR